MRIYISGPITGVVEPEANFEAAEQMLKDKGFEVCNPVRETAHLPRSTSWREFMGEDLKLLCGCDAIYMLKGWQFSGGARIELDVARQLGLNVYFYDYRVPEVS